jgi:hypothetical protein
MLRAEYDVDEADFDNPAEEIRNFNNPFEESS